MPVTRNQQGLMSAVTQKGPPRVEIGGLKITHPLSAGRLRRNGQSGAFPAILGWIERPSGATCGIRLIRTHLRRIQNHPPFRPPGMRLLPARLLPPWPPVWQPVQGTSHRRLPIRGAPVVALLIRRSSRPSSRPA
jgi:hypothetical protein